MAELVEGSLFAARYRMGRVLGRGGMGTVYRAQDETLGEPVAIKLLTRNDAGRAERFRREVRLARRVTHKHVARVFDLGEDGDRPYLTMEWIDGDSLETILERGGPLPEPEIVRIALQICDGLTAAHEAGIVHRDLKPANVLIERGGRVVITDFGIARALASDHAVLTDGAIGTPAYMAPEQLVGATVDARTDLYSLGLLLYELVTGKPPFAAVAIGARLVEDAPDPGLHAELSPTLRAAIRALAACEPGDRPASAAAAAALIRGEVPSKSPVTRLDRPAIARGGATVTVEAAAVTTPTQLPFAPLTHAAAPGVAVLPFRTRGTDPACDDDDLGEAFAEELVDVLARSRGLRVLTLGATRGQGDRPDLRRLATELGVAALVEGTIARRGPEVRVTARLVDAEGAQLWSERFDGRVEDVLGIGDELAQGVAENLRIELTTATRRGAAPAAAIDRYLSGRRKLRKHQPGGQEELEAALALAPDFAPAVALHALALTRMWFVPELAGQRDWESLSADAVERALEVAGDLPEAHLAAAVRAGQLGEYRTAANELARALEIAPTYAGAQEYLGNLQCEAGRGAEGTRRLRLAATLDPLLPLCLVGIARHHALHGRMAEYDATMAEVAARTEVGIISHQLRTRVCVWQGDLAGAEHFAADAGNRLLLGAPLLAVYAATATGAITPDEAGRRIEAFDFSRTSGRFVTFAHQIMAEACGAQNAREHALAHIDRALSHALADLEWLDLCPALACVRDTEEFAHIRAAVRVRTEAIWAG